MTTHQIDEGLYIGPFSESLTIILSANPPFTTIINVLENPVINPLMRINLENAGFKIIDHPIVVSNNPEIVVGKDRLDSLVDLIDSNKPCAVCCAAGVERSPLSAAWYLAKKRNISLDEAYRQIGMIHPDTQYRAYWVK
jgi:protein-tyrosine phosphatase